MRVGKWALAIGVLLSVAGCVDQQHEVQQYRRILDADVAQATPPLMPGDELSLVRALLLANQDNESLAIRGEDYVQALNDKARAFANFLPTITLAPSYTIVDNSEAATTNAGQGRPVGTSGGFKEVGKTLRRFEAPVNGAANLFRGFRDLASLEAADWTIEQKRQLLLDAQSTLLLQVAQTYYNVLRSEANVEVLRESLKAQQERVRDAKGRLDAGTGKPLDLAQAEAQSASTRVTLVQAQGDVANARTLLAFLIGTREVSGPLREDYDVPADVGTVQDLLWRAWTGREDYKAAQAAVETAVANVRNAVGEYYPSISLNITGYLYREDFTDASKWNSLLAVNLPIFSAGVIEADVRTAWSVLRQDAMRQSLLRRQVEDEVRERYQNFLTSTDKLTELGAQIRAAAEAYRQARAGYAAGTAIFLDVLSAQDVLLNSQLELTTETFNRKVIYLDLLRTTGRLKLGNVQRAATRPTTRPAAMPADMEVK
ncbi:MAG TPA: TolC family protein [Tepidisphaeraceae bacterium]|jgi:outer membrane protein TolC